jgi:hypothetical protein
MVYLLTDDGGIPELVEGENGGGVEEPRMAMPMADRPGGFAPQYPKSPSKGSGKGKDKEEVEEEGSELESEESEEDSPVLPRKH